MIATSRKTWAAVSIALICWLVLACNGRNGKPEPNPSSGIGTHSDFLVTGYGRGTIVNVTEFGAVGDGATTDDRPRNSFSHCTGNVLTGPLHGLMTDARVVNELGGFGALLRARAPLPDQSLAVAGALYGLRCLRQGRRNVSVRSVVCDEPPAPIRVPALPEADPF